MHCHSHRWVSTKCAVETTHTQARTIFVFRSVLTWQGVLLLVDTLQHDKTAVVRAAAVCGLAAACGTKCTRLILLSLSDTAKEVEMTVRRSRCLCLRASQRPPSVSATCSHYYFFFFTLFFFYYFFFCYCCLFLYFFFVSSSSLSFPTASTTTVASTPI